MSACAESQPLVPGRISSLANMFVKLVDVYKYMKEVQYFDT